MGADAQVEIKETLERWSKAAGKLPAWVAKVRGSRFFSTSFSHSLTLTRLQGPYPYVNSRAQKVLDKLSDAETDEDVDEDVDVLLKHVFCMVLSTSSDLVDLMERQSYASEISKSGYILPLIYTLLRHVVGAENVV